MTQSQINIEVSKYMHKYKEAARRGSTNVYESDEVVQIVLSQWLEKSEEDVLKIYNTNDKGIKNCVAYICKAIGIQTSSTKSRYYYEARKENRERITDIQTHTDSEGNRINPLENIAEEKDIDTNYLSEMVLDILDTEIFWYNAKLFKMNKLEGYTFREISEMTKIGRNSIFTTVNNTMAEVVIIAEHRMKELQKLDDYGILSEEEFRAKYREYDSPEVTYFQLLQAMTKFRGNRVEVMAYFGLTAKNLDRKLLEYKIKVTKNSHITKEVIEEAYSDEFKSNDEIAEELEADNLYVIMIKYGLKHLYLNRGKAEKKWKIEEEEYRKEVEYLEFCVGY